MYVYQKTHRRFYSANMPIPHADPHPRIMLSDEVRDRIRDAILSGAVQPGEQLSEAKLMRQFGVSRTTLRRALSDLTTNGLVEARANRSPRVAAVQDADAPNALFTLGVLMSGVVRFAIPTLGRVDHARQLEGIGRTIEAVETADLEYLARDTIDGYHRWADSCPNPFLAETLHQRVDVLGNALVSSESTVRQDTVLASLNLLRLAVHDHDAPAAVRAIDTMHRPDRLVPNRHLRNLRPADAARWSPVSPSHS